MFYKKKKIDDDASHALNAAVRFLARREYSKKELYQKLLTRYTKEAAISAIKKCLEEKWLSNERYAQMLLKHVVNQGYGPRKFLMQAQLKGLSSDDYQDEFEAIDWTEIATKHLIKKYQGLEISYEQRDKILSSLARRGFSNSCCIEALTRFLEEQD